VQNKGVLHCCSYMFLFHLGHKRVLQRVNQYPYVQNLQFTGSHRQMVLHMKEGLCYHKILDDGRLGTDGHLGVEEVLIVDWYDTGNCVHRIHSPHDAL